MVVFIFFALVLYFFIMFIFKIKKDKNYAFLASIACSILLIFTYIFNMGWIRLMYIFLFLAHIILFSISSIKMSKCLLHKNDTLLLIILYCVSLLASLSLPDQGDIGASYAFMGLVSPADYSMIFPISLYVVSTVLSLYLLGKSISEKHEINLSIEKEIRENNNVILETKQKNKKDKSFLFKIIIFPIIIILLYLVGARAVAIIAYTLYIILFSINKNDYEHIKVVKIIYIISVILFIIYVLWIFDIIPSLITLFEDIFDYIASLFK